MLWSHVAAYVFGGVFLANFFPHFIAGMSGVRFYTPFASPPFRGLSSPVINVLYALLNLAIAYALLVLVGQLDLQAIAYALLVLVGQLDLHDGAQVAVAAAGFGLWSVMIARSVTKLREAVSARNPGS